MAAFRSFRSRARSVLPTLMLMAPALACAGGQVATVFHREEIRVEPQAGALRVIGFYVFRNDAERDESRVIFYPLPLDSRHPFPDEIIVTTVTDTLDWHRSANGVRFRVDVPAGGETSFTVEYSQPCLDDAGCYILTTTRAWHRPLARADFTIVIADSLSLHWMSYSADDTVRTDAGTVLRFTRTGFLPDRDLCLRWSVAGQ